MRGRAALLACVALAACTPGPRTGRPAPPVPPAWPQGDAYLAQDHAALPAVRHTDIFRDERLQKLFAAAFASNRDLRIAAANIAAARASVRIQRAAQLPVIGVGADATLRGGDGRSTARSYAIDGGVSGFELDLFGRLAALSRAEQERLLGTQAAAQTVRLGLMSDIAQIWATHAADAELLGIAQDTATSASRSVALTRARLEGGIAARTDLRQAEQVLATAQGDVAAQRTALAQDVNLLQLLLGAPVDPALLPVSIAQASESIATLPAGLDSTILLRRPDVLEAEYQLRAANAEIGAARAALFPRISLTGLLGVASDALGALFSGGAFNWTAGAAATYPIFSGGAGRAGVALSQAQRDAALAGYERAIQSAFREVADALARQGTISDELRAVESLSAAAADTARLTELRYRGGIDPFLSSLDAQRSLYVAQRREIAVRLDSAINRIALYRALGGDALGGEIGLPLSRK